MLCNVGKPSLLTSFQPALPRFAPDLPECKRRWGVISHELVGRPEMKKFVKLLKNMDGATAIEYGLIAALIAVAAIGAMQGIGNRLNTTFNNVANNLASS